MANGVPWFLTAVESEMTVEINGDCKSPDPSLPASFTESVILSAEPFPILIDPSLIVQSDCHPYSTNQVLTQRTMNPSELSLPVHLRS